MPENSNFSNSPLHMDVQIWSEDDRIRIVRIEGYLDTHTAIEFEREMEARVRQGEKFLVLDAAQLHFISSAGVGALMGLIHTVRNQGGEVVLARPEAKVLHTLEMCGFSRTFPIAEGPDEAARLIVESF